MDVAPGANSGLPISTNHNTTAPHRYSPDTEMTKRQLHPMYDQSVNKKDLGLYSCLPKFSLIILRRYWNLKLIFILILTSVFVTFSYIGAFSLLVPSSSFNVLIGQSDTIQVPRVNIQLGEPEDFKRFHTRDNSIAAQQQKDEGNIGDDYNDVQQTPKGQKRLPSVIIFGVSKCGTRAVLEYLKLHPDVVAPMAEINFFNNETLYKQGYEWYLEQMPRARDYQLIVEKSPDYFQSVECAPLIRQMNSSIKLILLLRDPVERLVSQFMQLLEKNPNLPRFEDWVINSNTEHVNSNIRSVMVSAYSKYLETWLSVFQRDQLLIIESDSLRQNPHTEMKRVEKFLHLKPYFKPSDFYFNSTRGFYCLRHRSTGKTKCLGKSKGRQHIPVDKNVLELLYSFYEPYNERLNDLLGTTFPWS